MRAPSRAATRTLRDRQARRSMAEDETDDSDMEFEIDIEEGDENSQEEESGDEDTEEGADGKDGSRRHGKGPAKNSMQQHQQLQQMQYNQQLQQMLMEAPKGPAYPVVDSTQSSEHRVVLMRLDSLKRLWFSSVSTDNVNIKKRELLGDTQVLTLAPTTYNSDNKRAFGEICPPHVILSDGKRDDNKRRKIKAEKIAIPVDMGPLMSFCPTIDSSNANVGSAHSSFFLFEESKRNTQIMREKKTHIEAWTSSLALDKSFTEKERAELIQRLESEDGLDLKALLDSVLALDKLDIKEQRTFTPQDLSISLKMTQLHLNELSRLQAVRLHSANIHRIGTPSPRELLLAEKVKKSFVKILTNFKVGVNSTLISPQQLQSMMTWLLETKYPIYRGTLPVELPQVWLDNTVLKLPVPNSYYMPNYSTPVYQQPSRSSAVMNMTPGGYAMNNQNIRRYNAPATPSMYY